MSKKLVYGSLRGRAGYTLVELLVGISIVGLLMALLGSALFSGWAAAKAGVISLEIGDMSDALEFYKMRFGHYPPSRSLGNDLGRIQFMKHLRRRCPRHRFADFAAVRREVAAVTRHSGGKPLDLMHLDAAEFLVLWLGGLSAGDTLRPLSSNGFNPFSAAARTSLYEFDATRLVDSDGDGWWEFRPRHSPAPYVYFDHLGYAAAQYGQGTSFGLAVPYAARESATDVQFREADSFQIICAGLDGTYGPARRAALPQFPSGAHFDATDQDNQTSFASGRLMASLH